MIEANDFLKEFFTDLQGALGILLKDSYQGIDIGKLRVVASVDAAYRGDLMSVAAVEWDLEKGPLSETVFTCKPPYPYVPGLLFLREGPPMLHAVKQLGNNWQLLLVDAHGLLHPRRMGLAVFLGFLLNKPAVGIAKSLLVGLERSGAVFGEVEVDGEVLGYWFKFGRSKKFYASPGYLVKVQQIPEIIKKLGNTYPEVLRFVDRRSKEILRKKSDQ
ncbi:MAG: endonuclease V [Armatimonadetes bacterium]|nr:endonuclease V [Armatimonadota bacterium]